METGTKKRAKKMTKEQLDEDIEYNRNYKFSIIQWLLRLPDSGNRHILREIFQMCVFFDKTTGFFKATKWPKNSKK